MTNSEIVGLAERVKDLEAENGALRGSLTDILSTLDAVLPEDDFYYERQRARAAIEAYEQARSPLEDNSNG